MQATLIRFEEVKVESVPGQWATMTPAEFYKIPITERVQLILGRKVRFFAGGSEVSALDALMD